ncbi:hypothetical protein [Oceanobacter mangrovi]|uniref:hypothetical protein n=1 Tax=Oceanobacter mangrovi TaxID=2862510 RepID=UPI001C8DB501|nr:hypothetical protein [Oceanobacter mangrovi]
MPTEQHYRDLYSQADTAMSMIERIQRLYWVLRQQYSGLDRFSIALYHEHNDSLSTFTCVGDNQTALNGYVAQMCDVPSLKQLVEQDSIRVVNDMRQFRADELSEHTAKLLGQGYRASFSMALRDNDRLLGILFLNSHQIDYFDDSMAVYCSLWGHLVEQVVAREQTTLRRLRSLLGWTMEAAGLCTDGSAGRINRVSLLAQGIARQLQAAKGLSDSWVEYLGLFAPFYDLARVQAGGRCEAGSRLEGSALLERAISLFELERLEHIDIARNIVAYHTAQLADPAEVTLAELPLEARISEVAALADQGLSAGKTAESVAAYLNELVRAECLDAECVEALLTSWQQESVAAEPA